MNSGPVGSIIQKNNFPKPVYGTLSDAKKTDLTHHLMFLLWAGKLDHWSIFDIFMLSSSAGWFAQQIRAGERSQSGPIVYPQYLYWFTKLTAVLLKEGRKKSFAECTLHFFIRLGSAVELWMCILMALQFRAVLLASANKHFAWLQQKANQPSQPDTEAASQAWIETVLTKLPQYATPQLNYRSNKGDCLLKVGRAPQNTMLDLCS